LAGQWLDRAEALAPSMVWPRVVRVRWLERIAAPHAARLAAIHDLLRLAPGDVFGLRALELLTRAASEETPGQTQASAADVAQTGQFA
jgi:hypothetical protein